MPTAIEDKRTSYAALVKAKARVADPRVERAFATVPREEFVGSGPWKTLTQSGYVETPSADPAMVYEDVPIALRPEKGINNGQPSLHARCMDAAGICEGDRVLHIGCGSGYYTALLAELAGRRGRVIGWDVEAELAALAHRNLARWTNVSAECRSGTEPPIPDCDFIYVSAGCSDLPRLWCDALADGGRLVFPLTPVRGVGGMLKLTRCNAAFRAEFIARCQFIPCVGADSPLLSLRLAAAFARGDSDRVRSLRFGSPQPELCWFAGNGWWLATE